MAGLLLVFASLATACSSSIGPVESGAGPEQPTMQATEQPTESPAPTPTEQPTEEPTATVAPTPTEEPEPTSTPLPLAACQVELVDVDITGNAADNTVLASIPEVVTPGGDEPAGEAYDIVQGSGDVVQAGDTLVVNYVGLLWSTGERFDSSWDPTRTPFVFEAGAGQVITGWDLGLVDMAVGGRRQLVLPPGCAYGQSGSASGGIGPNETLIFVVDLVAIEPTIELPDSVGETATWEDLVVGEGPALANGDTGVIEWVAVYFETGTKIGSSVSAGVPLTFMVGRDTLGLLGFDESIAGMQVGGVRQLVLPNTETTADNETVIIRAELVGLIPATDPSDKPAVTVPTADTDVLVIEDLSIGDGETVETGSTLFVNYVGVFYPDGEQFDSSWDRAEPFTFTVGDDQVILGWEQGFLGMKVGGRRMLVIPPELAYGTLAPGEESEPGSVQGRTLVFVVDLLAIVG